MDLSVLLRKVKQAALDAAADIAGTGELQVQVKGPNDYVTQVDIQVSEFLCAELPKLLPDSRVISEEGNSAAAGGSYHWIIDPIDGTNNLLYGYPTYAISIGLELDRKPILGVVYNPLTREIFSAAEGQGAFWGDQRIQVNTVKDLSRSLVITETDPYFDRLRNRSIQLIQAVYHKCLDCRINGSAALDLSFIAAGRAGAQFCQTINPWDYAGAAAILTEAGGKMSQWDGSPLPFEGKHTLLATNGYLHDEMLELIAAFLKSAP